MLELAKALSDCNETLVLQLIQEQLAAGVSPTEIVTACNAGMIEVGERFDCGDAFIPDLMFAGMIITKGMELLQPHFDAAPAVEEKKRTLLIGTVENDIHDIGKDITAMVFRSSGYNVIDLGVDVKAAAFVAAIQEHKPDFVGMSLLLTTCYQSVLNTMTAIKEAGLRECVKIGVGGAAATQLLADKAGCDFYGKTAVDFVRWASENV
ncbi:MAG: cobalamin B12-binding domain-containing protein [Thermoguttaceae bacterium]